MSSVDSNKAGALWFLELASNPGGLSAVDRQLGPGAMHHQQAPGADLRVQPKGGDRPDARGLPGTHRGAAPERVSVGRGPGSVREPHVSAPELSGRA